jgi:hypothetical protein
MGKMKNLKLQYFIGVFLFMVASISFTSCSSSKYSQSDVNRYLSKERVKAKTSSVSFRIPQGWHVVDANNKAFIDLWIVRDDLNVSLSFIPFHSNSTSFSLKKSYESSILLQQAKFKNKIKIQKEKNIELNNIKVKTYSFKVAESEYRVALFKIGNTIYESILFGDGVNLRKEYFIQELVILSAKFSK